MAISFSNQAKEEICRSITGKPETIAFLAGLLCTAKQLQYTEIVIQTECAALAELLPKALRTVYPKLAIQTQSKCHADRQTVTTLRITDAYAIPRLCKRLQLHPDRRVYAVSQQTAASMPYFVAGIFVANGSMTDPTRSYHMEITMPDAEFAQAVIPVFSGWNIPIKLMQRKGDQVLYLKQNQQIADTLAIFGAQDAYFTMVDAQVYRSVRGQTNRRTNCDLANIDKAIAAGAQQVQDITLIVQTVGIESLSPALRVMAEARLQAPEATLEELGAMMQPPLSRSGVYHRLQRISAYAKTLRAEQAKSE